jgi:putative ABC transport system permease protein
MKIMIFCDWLHRRRQRETDLDEEIQAHLRLAAEERRAQGESTEEAHAAAIREFGNVASVKEVTRDMWGGRWFEHTARDMRYGLRMLCKSWVLTTTLVVTLALGIGANTSIFSVLNGWLLRPLPVRAPEQIMVLAFRIKHVADSHFSYPDLVEFQKQASAFSGVFGYAVGAAGFSAGGNPTEFAYSAVTGNYFSTLGVKPLIGRLLLPGEGEKRSKEILAVLGYSFWQKRLGGNPGVVGKQVLINGKQATVIGVVPRDFHGTFFAFEMDGYLSLNAVPLLENSSDFWTARRDRELFALGRLRLGMSRTRAQSIVDVVAGRLSTEYPASDKGATIRVIPETMARPAPFVTDFVPVIAGLFLVLPALVLLLACLNVANILLARATARRREMAVRAALGAGRGRLIRQMLTESLLLAFVGGASGVVFGEWAIHAAGLMLRPITSTTSSLAYHLDARLDWRVFTYTLAAALLSGILVGIWPALRLGRVSVNAVLHEGGRSDSRGAARHRGRNLLLVAQVAGSLTLLVAAGLFVLSLKHAEHMDLGFDPDHVVNAMLDLRQIGFDDARSKVFFRELEEGLRARPGVQSASLSYTVPLGMPSADAAIYIEDHPLPPGQPAPQVSYNGVDPGYFETLRVPIVAGRTFTDSDDEAAPWVAIVNESMAKQFWPNQDPLGKRFSLESAHGPFISVVGLARDGQTGWAISPNPRTYFYIPLAQGFRSSLMLQVRTSLPPESMIPVVEAQIHKLAPDLPILNISTMQQAVHGLGGLFMFQLAATLAAAMGVLGLALAAVGVYGVVSFSVARRTHEIGIRMALGAKPRDVLAEVARQGLQLTLIGIGIGLLAALGLSQMLRSLLLGVNPGDPVTFISVSLFLLAVALVATYLPARRATKVDPVVALRHE